MKLAALLLVAACGAPSVQKSRPQQPAPLALEVPPIGEPLEGRVTNIAVAGSGIAITANKGFADGIRHFADAEVIVNGRPYRARIVAIRDHDSVVKVTLPNDLDTHTIVVRFLPGDPNDPRVPPPSK